MGALERIGGVARVTTLSLALTALAAPGHAQDRAPVTRVVTQQGEDAAVELAWDLSLIEVRGLADPAVERRINARLRREVEQVRAAMLEALRAWPAAGDETTSSGLRVRMTVGAVTPDLVSVSFTTSTYYAGAAHPNHEVGALTFDLRTGEVVPVRDLFRPGAEVMARVAERVDAALRASGDYAWGGEHVLAAVAAGHLHAARLDPDGVTFFFGDDELGPHAAGTPTITLTYADLRDLLAQDGPAASLATASRGLVGALGPR